VGGIIDVVCTHDRRHGSRWHGRRRRRGVSVRMGTRAGGAGQVTAAHAYGEIRGCGQSGRCARTTVVIKHTPGFALFHPAACPSPASARAGNALCVSVHEVEGHHWMYRKGKGGLARVSPRLQVPSSAGKPSAGGGALPKKGQGQRRFVSIRNAIRHVGPFFLHLYFRSGQRVDPWPTLALSRRDFGRACTTRVPLQSRLRTFLVAALSHSGWPTVVSSHI
jgi:hypothetical protein